GLVTRCECGNLAFISRSRFSEMEFLRSGALVIQALRLLFLAVLHAGECEREIVHSENDEASVPVDRARELDNVAYRSATIAELIDGNVGPASGHQRLRGKCVPIERAATPLGFGDEDRPAAEIRVSESAD